MISTVPLEYKQISPLLSALTISRFDATGDVGPL